MLRFVLGRSGYGKTTKIIDIINNELNNNQKVILIVPEQITFETEKKLLNSLGTARANRVKVLSFSRLANFVKKHYMISNRNTVIDDSLRLVLMQMTVSEVADGLSYYKKESKRSSFASRIMTSILNLKQNNITPTDLTKASLQVNSSSLSTKLKDLALLMSSYDSYIASKYIDPADELSKLAEILEVNHFFTDYIVLFDDFWGFTSQEYKIIEFIVKQSKDCYFSLTSDNIYESDGADYFIPVKKTINKLMNIAKRNHIAIAAPVYLNQQFRFNNSQLAFLEKNYLTDEFFPHETENIEIFIADNKYSEAKYVCGKIVRLVREKQLRLSDIAIITGDCSEYIGIIDIELKKCGLNCFFDKPKNVISNPLFGFAFLLLDLISEGFEKNAILKIIKTGFIDLSMEESAALENYILCWNITHKGFFSQWTANPRGFISELNDADRQQLKELNILREKLVSLLSGFFNKCKNAGGKEICIAVYELLKELNVEQKLLQNVKYFDSMGEQQLKDENKRVWNILTEMLDKLVLAMGDNPIHPKQFKELFYSMAASTEIGYIPLSVDSIVMGDAIRIRPVSPKYTFIIGAVSASFPKKPVEDELFSRQELEELRLNGVEIAKPVEELAFDDIYLTYMALSSPSDGLFITYPKNDFEGNELHPCEMVEYLINYYKNVRLNSESTLSISDKIESKQDALYQLAKNINQPSELTNTLSLLLDDKAYLDKLKKEKYSTKYEIEEKDISAELFGKNLKISPSSLDLFSKCPFAFYCRYGLRLKAFRKADLGYPESGNIIHFVLENIIKRYKAEELYSLVDTEIKGIISQLVYEYILNILGDEEKITPRLKYFIGRLNLTLHSIIRQIASELIQSEFVPSEFELEIDRNKDIEPLELTTPEGVSITVYGKVDRVDTYEKDGITYIRIIDYKSGANDLRLSDVIEGLNLQMLIYLFAITQKDTTKYKNIAPAGVLFQPYALPNLTVDRTADSNTVNNLVSRKYRMNGILIDNAEVLKAMEANLKGLFIPARMTRDGSFDKDSRLVSLEELGILKKKIEKQLEKMADELHNGKIPAYPAYGSDYCLDCEKCDYYLVCNITDQSDKRRIANYSFNDSLKILKGEQLNDK